MLLQIGTFGRHVALIAGLVRFHLPVCLAADRRKGGREGHTDGDDGGKQRCLARFQQTKAARQGEQHEAELSRLPQQQRRMHADACRDSG